MIHTASEGISFARQLENQAGSFYESLAQHFLQNSSAVLALVKENQRFIQQIERAYYGVITDALEGCFAFNIEPEDYILNVTLPAETNFSKILDQAKQIEEKMIQFYTTASQQSESLVPDVSRAFLLVVKKRQNRLAQLGSLISP